MEIETSYRKRKQAAKSRFSIFSLQQTKTLWKIITDTTSSLNMLLLYWLLKLAEYVLEVV